MSDECSGMISLGDEKECVITNHYITDYTLTVSKSGTGSGTVTSSPAGIDCGSGCNYDYPEGTEVTLTASAASGSSFAGWSGDCSGTDE